MIDLGSSVAIKINGVWVRGRVIQRVGNMVWVKIDKSGKIVIKNRNYRNVIRALK